MADRSSDGVYAKSALTPEPSREHEEDDPIPNWVRSSYDGNEPAIWNILAEMWRLQSAGVLSPETVHVAVQLGRATYERLDAMRDHRKESTPENVVYYIRRGDLIKIGTTKNLERRLKDLIPDEVLAVEPGGYRIERSRHLEFADLRVAGDAKNRRREYFVQAEPLLSHIAKVRQMFGIPDLNYRPLSA